ncbi:MAG: restriction endonuclease subunit S [Clostridia bacterium]|nr:restriction endonuclease subunit S [Clostridia bacterium]
MRFLECVDLNPKITMTKGHIYPFVEMANVSTCYRSPDNVETKPFDSGVKFQDGDTVIARITPCLQNGKRFYCQNIGTGFGSTEYLVFRPKDDSVDNKYLYYFMMTDFVKQSMINSMTGATGRQRVNNDVFNDIEVCFPDIDIQRKIGEILSAYDNLIENNQKQIKLLEEAAQRLYKEWFVNLRFPGYEDTPIVDGVPEGWKKVGLASIAPIVTGKKDANFGAPDGKYLFFTCAQEPIKAPSYSFDCDAVILAGNGDFNVKLYRGQFEAYQRTYVFSPYDKNHLYLLYHAVRESMRQLFQGASGSTIKFLTKHMLEDILVYIPEDSILQAYNSNCEAIQKKIERLKEQIICSQEARDRLLPKLMSGEIEV